MEVAVVLSDVPYQKCNLWCTDGRWLITLDFCGSVPLEIVVSRHFRPIGEESRVDRDDPNAGASVRGYLETKPQHNCGLRPITQINEL